MSMKGVCQGARPIELWHIVTWIFLIFGLYYSKKMMIDEDYLTQSLLNKVCEGVKAPTDEEEIETVELQENEV